MMSRRIALGTLSALLLMSLAVNVLLIRQRQQLANSEARVLPPGSPVPPLQVLDLSGRLLTVKYHDVHVPTVLYVFRPSCTWCEKNANDVRYLVTRLGPKARFVAISTSRAGLASYVQEHPELPIVGSIAEQLQREYGIEGTPQTIVVGPNGDVLANWLGAFRGDVRGEIEKFFSVHFL